jgi:hypothetical protein
LAESGRSTTIQFSSIRQLVERPLRGTLYESN